MPQPLSKFAHPKRVFLGAGGGREALSDHNPAIALLAMKVITEWSNVEERISVIFIKMLGANPVPGAAIYSALSGTASQKAAVRGVARVALSPAENDVLEALLSLFTTAAKARNKIAHWIWGYCDYGPILCEPSAYIDWNAASESGVKMPHLYPLKNVYVYTEQDMQDLIGKITRLHALLTTFYIVLLRTHPANQGGVEFVRLSGMPEVRTFLDRLQQGRKTDQQTGQLQPDKPHEE
jgi:hypothetical protein